MRSIRTEIKPILRVVTEITSCLRRFSTILATLAAGFAFVFATSLNAAAGDKKVEIKNPEKIEKLEGFDSKAFFNRNAVRNNFNPFFRGFAVDDDDFFFVNRFDRFDDRFDRFDRDDDRFDRFDRDDD